MSIDYSCISIQQSCYLFKGSCQNLLENREEAAVAGSWKEVLEVEEEVLVEAAAGDLSEEEEAVTEAVAVDLEVAEEAVDLIVSIQVEVEEEEEEEDTRL